MSKPNIDLKSIAKNNFLDLSEDSMESKLTTIEDTTRTLVPIYPWVLVDIIEGVSDKGVVSQGISEIISDNKFAGKHMDICRVVRMPEVPSNQSSIPVANGDTIAVWSKSTEEFSFTDQSLGTIYMVRVPDIFCKVE